MTKLSLLFLSFCTFAAAQPAADLDKRLADLEKAAKAAQSAGDNAWMLTSAALVLMMTGPGLAISLACATSGQKISAGGT